MTQDQAVIAAAIAARAGDDWIAQKISIRTLANEEDHDFYEDVSQVWVFGLYKTLAKKQAPFKKVRVLRLHNGEFRLGSEYIPYAT